MKRRIYIVDKDTKIDDSLIKKAAIENCSEIIRGIPRILIEKRINIPNLPFIYEEDNIAVVTQPISEDVKTLKKLVASIQDDINKLKESKDGKPN